MPAPRRFLGEQAQTVEARAAAMRKPLESWMRQYARAVRRALADRNLIQKQTDLISISPLDRERLENQLMQILWRFGNEQMQSAIEVGAATVGAEVSITQQITLEFFREKEIKVVEIMEATQRASQDAIRGILEEALTESPRPSTTEIGRRLRNRLNFGTTVEGASFAFSPERAQLIARTEMVQAVNTGITNGYRLAGIRRHKWVSYQDDRSGRGHDKMLGQTREVGVPFVAPDGTELLYPGDPNAPIRHTANCRCTTVPVIEARQ